MIPDLPDNSVYQLISGVIVIVLGFLGQRFAEPPPSESPEVAARRLRNFRDACVMAIGFGLCVVYRFVFAARRAHGVQW